MQVEKEDTGIFVRTTVTHKGIKGIYDALTAEANRTILDELKDWESEARRILRENGFDKFPCKLLESTPVEAKDARELIYAIMGTRDFIKQNNALSAAFCAFRAGHIATRLTIRPHEKPAKAGRPILKVLEKGRRVSGRYDAAKRRNEAWIKQFKTLKPSLSVINRCTIVANYFNDPMRLSEEDRLVTVWAVKKAVQKYLTK